MLLIAALSIRLQTDSTKEDMGLIKMIVYRRVELDGDKSCDSGMHIAL